MNATLITWFIFVWLLISPESLLKEKEQLLKAEAGLKDKITHPRNGISFSLIFIVPV